jgi:hypothetical protein
MFLINTLVGAKQFHTCQMYFSTMFKFFAVPATQKEASVAALKDDQIEFFTKSRSSFAWSFFENSSMFLINTPYIMMKLS